LTVKKLDFVPCICTHCWRFRK